MVNSKMEREAERFKRPLKSSKFRHLLDSEKEHSACRIGLRNLFPKMEKLRKELKTLEAAWLTLSQRKYQLELQKANVKKIPFGASGASGIRKSKKKMTKEEILAYIEELKEIVQQKKEEEKLNAL